MNSIHVISPLSLSPDGPASSSGPVHLRQGDADGACGPYCVLMALLACGLINREQVKGSDAQDRRTRMGRVWAKFGEFGPLVKDGTDDDDIEAMMTAYSSSVKVIPPNRHGPVALNDFIVSSLMDNFPVIVGIHTEDDQRHWLLAIGIDDAPKGIRLLVLDSACEASPIAAWNAVITLSAERRKHPSHYWSQRGEIFCLIESALAIHPNTTQAVASP